MQNSTQRQRPHYQGGWREAPEGFLPETMGVRNMKAFITVIGHDTVGVVAKVAALCCELNINAVRL